MTSLLPIRRQVVVPGTPAAAFDVFTVEIGLWWPLDEHSVYGEGSSVRFDGGRLIERGPEGDEAVWGTVLSWVPERHVRLTWHPGSDPAKASEVEVRFETGQRQPDAGDSRTSWLGAVRRPGRGASRV